jgi:2-hydroxychromene-2-carboxylate isomerase
LAARAPPIRHDRLVVAAPLFFFGAMSPYAWFAAERIERLLPDAEWRAVFLGGMFKANGRASWALDERREAGIVECEARARDYGLAPMRWPEPWPTSDLTVARAMVLAAARGLLKPFALAAMRMAFREGADLAQTAVVLEAGHRTGIDAGELAAALTDPEVKGALRAATDDALARGVFGVPTVIVREELFWGDDRLEQAAAVSSAAP